MRISFNARLHESYDENMMLRQVIDQQQIDLTTVKEHNHELLLMTDFLRKSLECQLSFMQHFMGQENQDPPRR